MKSQIILIASFNTLMPLCSCECLVHISVSGVSLYLKPSLFWKAESVFIYVRCSIVSRPWQFVCNVHEIPRKLDSLQQHVFILSGVLCFWKEPNSLSVDNSQPKYLITVKPEMRLHLQASPNEVTKILAVILRYPRVFSCLHFLEKCLHVFSPKRGLQSD